MKLEPGMVAVVTGAASGMGYSMCDAWAKRGLAIVMADIESEALEQSAEKIRKTGAEVLAVNTDVGELGDVRRLHEVVMEQFGHVDLLANNAGIFGGVLPTWEWDHADWEWAIRVNLWGVIHGVEVFLPSMVERDAGHIVNTASMAGLGPIAYTTPYNVTKYGVLGLTESIAAELRLRNSNVGITALCPGNINTNIGNSSRNRPADLTPINRKGPAPIMGENQEEIDLLQKMMKQPVYIGFMEPDEVAAMVTEAVEASSPYLLTGADVVGMLQLHMDQLEPLLKK